jgi:hypothetical protein
VAELGYLEKISDLRSIWNSESEDFTPWLAEEENLKLLGDTIGIDLVLDSQEKCVGSYRADILCKDTITRRWVLIENQIEKTDHSHLGQILTYAASLDATTIVWIAKYFTEEHRAALDWLNKITDDEFNFFGLEIELWKIGNSPTAPKFNVICKPNDWSRTQREIVKGERTVTPEKRLLLDYWSGFVEFLRERQSALKNDKPKPFDHLSFALGNWETTLSALSINKDNKIGVQIYIKGPNAITYFEQLQRDRASIEKAIETELEWNDSRKKERSIDLFKGVVDIKILENWPDQYEWLYMNLEAFYAAFNERIKKLKDQQENSVSPDSEGSTSV